MNVLEPDGGFVRSWATEFGGLPTRPVDIAVNASGYVFVTVVAPSSAVLVFGPGGTLYDEWSSYTLPDPDPMTTHSFVRPTGIACGPDNHVYVSVWGLSDVAMTPAVLEFSPGGILFEVHTLPGFFSSRGSQTPVIGVAVDSQEVIFASDTLGDAIYQLVPGETTWNGWSAPTPSFLAVDANRNLFVTSAWAGIIGPLLNVDGVERARMDGVSGTAVTRFSPSGVVLAAFGLHGYGDDQLRSPTGATVGTDG